MLASFGFAAFFAGIIGTVAMLFIPGNQMVLSVFSGTFTGAGLAALLGAILVHFAPNK